MDCNAVPLPTTSTALSDLLTFCFQDAQRLPMMRYGVPRFLNSAGRTANAAYGRRLALWENDLSPQIYTHSDSYVTSTALAYLLRVTLLFSAQGCAIPSPLPSKGVRSYIVFRVPCAWIHRDILRPSSHSLSTIFSNFFLCTFLRRTHSVQIFCKKVIGFLFLCSTSKSTTPITIDCQFAYRLHFHSLELQGQSFEEAKASPKQAARKPPPFLLSFLSFPTFSSPWRFHAVEVPRPLPSVVEEDTTD